MQRRDPQNFESAYIELYRCEVGHVTQDDMPHLSL